MKSNTSRAFTMIEVLVAMSIIALLIAILLPSLSRFRQSVKEVTCMNNMAQLMQAEINYSLDNDGMPPHYDEWIWNRDSLRDHPYGLKMDPADRLRPTDDSYFGNYRNDYTTKMAPKYGTIETYVDDFNAHFCPQAPEMPVNDLKGGTDPIGEEVVRSYVQNQMIDPNGALGGSYTTMEEIVKPSAQLVLTEENTFIMNHPRAFQHPMNDGKLDRSWDSIGSIHRRKDVDNLRSGFGVGTFADGHVDWVFSQGQVRHGGRYTLATPAFMQDSIPNPTEQDADLIDESMDFSFSY